MSITFSDEVDAGDTRVQEAVLLLCAGCGIVQGIECVVECADSFIRFGFLGELLFNLIERVDGFVDLSRGFFVELIENVFGNSSRRFLAPEVKLLVFQRLDIGMYSDDCVGYFLILGECLTFLFLFKIADGVVQATLHFFYGFSDGDRAVMADWLMIAQVSRGGPLYAF